MKDLAKTCKVAVVQASPVLFDKEATLDKAVKLIEEAASRSVNLILFPEVFIPAYPRGLTYGYVVGSRTMEGARTLRGIMTAPCSSQARTRKK